ncbi:hypothetical protein [Laspinema olomoucense]|uniref:hypothetical protein n=1 Tax=Laspinema olomoucense TaxID=3231600 RepID=UPI0021BBA9D0|nr:hypothetical protein [Laspinema sp. D3c]
MKPGRGLGSGPVYELSAAAIAFGWSIGFNKSIGKLLIPNSHILGPLRADDSSVKC